VRDKDEFSPGSFPAGSGYRLRETPSCGEFRLENAVIGERKISSGTSPLMEFRARRDKQGATKEAQIAPIGMKVNSPDERSASLRK